MIRRYLVLTLMASLILSSCTKNKFVVSGIISDAENHTLTFSKVDIKGDIIIDSLKLTKKGNFKFKQKSLETPTFFKIGLSDNKYITIIGDSTEHIIINANNKNFSTSYSVENSQSSEEIKEHNARLLSLQSKVDSLVNLYNNLSVAEKQLQIENVNNELLSHL
ncbi:MAG: DUF4369 domain-containing protein, partial [Bacteroidales bacterium]|nr:DUF4369 domain-containing protein [Bacteroidales bacterium]